MNYGMKRSIQAERSGEKGRWPMLIESYQIIHVGEAMRSIVNCMNTLRMYRPQVRESQMTAMIDRQLEHMMGICNNILNYAKTKEINNIIPDRIMNWQANVNQMDQPINMNTNPLDDRDMVWCMTSSLKACVMSLSVATMACSEDTIRRMLMNSCTSYMNMVYDMVTYMNQRGTYQSSNIQANAISSPMHIYQPMSVMSEMQYQ